MAESAAPGPPRRVFILDTSALLEGVWSHADAPAWTPPGVAAELQGGGRSRARFDHLVAAGLQVRPVDPDALLKARAKARAHGETMLSETDLEVAALAWQARGQEREPIVVTDDYALQNLLAHMGLSFQSGREAGIRTKRNYLLRCSGCGRRFPPDTGRTHGDDCPTCGSPLRRRQDRGARR